MHRALFVFLLIGCSNPAGPETTAADAAPAADSGSELHRDVEGIVLDEGIGPDTGSCGHDICHNFDDGRISPLFSTAPTVLNGGELALDPVARSNPNSLRATTQRNHSAVPVARIQPQLAGAGANARMKFAMRLDPITFEATEPGFIYLASMHLDDVSRNISLGLNKDGFFIDGWYGEASDGGLRSVDLPRKSFAARPAFNTWIDVELTVTPAGDGARAVVSVGSESVTIDMAASVTNPIGPARFDLGLQTVLTSIAPTVRFDDLTIDTGG